MNSNHSIIFTDPKTQESFDTYKDWHLVPDKMPIVAPPAQKTKFVDIPGANGHIDMSDTLTGYPVFENRTGSFEFIVLNEFNEDLDDLDESEWSDRFSDIMDFLHGKVMQMVLIDDPGFYYLGRITVSKLEPGESNSQLAFSYNLDPYKWKVIDTVEDWLWDPFDFDNDYIDTGIYDITVNSSSYQTFTFDKKYELSAPVIPVFKVTAMTSTITMEFINQSLGIDVTYPLSLGDNEFLDCIITNTSNWVMKLKGTGTLSVVYRKGRL